MKQSQGYEPRWDLDLRRGLEGEKRVADLLGGIAAETVEVKRDDRAVTTGNIYIEHACRYNGEWRHSGISTTEADVWVFVVGDLFLGLPTDLLRALHGRWLADQRGLLECSSGSHPTKGVVIPIRELVDAARSLASKDRRAS